MGNQRTFNLAITAEEADYIRELLVEDSSVLSNGDFEESDWAGEARSMADRVICALDDAKTLDQRLDLWNRNSNGRAATEPLDAGDLVLTEEAEAALAQMQGAAHA